MANSHRVFNVFSVFSVKRSSRAASFLMFAFAMAGIFVLAAPPAFASTPAGPSNGSTFANVSSGTGSYAWTNTSNAQTSNGIYATSTITSNGFDTEYLEATGFNFDIPAGATINGIQVRVDRNQYCTGTCTSSVTDYSVKLVQGGTIVGNEEASTTSWTTTETTADYGGSADMWGVAWTPAQINASNFGFVFSAKRNSGGTRTAEVDYMAMTVYYTPANSTTTLASSLNPSTYGSSVTFTATVNGSSTTPTGVVTFKDGATTLGTSTLSSGVATFLTSTLATSTHSITAAYGGDTNYASSTSSVLTQTVNKQTVTASVTASNKTYNGTSTASIATCSLSGNPANVTCSAAGATFSDKNASSTGKIVTATGITLGGTNAGNYQLSSTSATTTANIAPLAITVTAATNSKTYDATTTAAAIPTITSGSLASGDTANFTETYSNKTVGTGIKTLIPAGTVSDGNGGNNYTVTLANSTNGTITAKALTVSATGVAKVYDGTTAATVTLSDNRISGDVLTATSSAATFSDKNVGTGKTVNVSGISISGTDAGNYTVNTTATATANISARPITVTANNASKIIGASDPALTYTISSSTPLESGDSVTGTLVRVAGETVGTYDINQGTLTAGANYTVTFVKGTFTINPSPTSQLTVNLALIGGGSAAPSDFLLTVTDATSTLANNVAATSTQQFTLNVGDSYGVAEATTTNSQYYTVSPSSACSGTVGTSSIACTITDAFVQPTATVQVVTNVINDNGGTDSASNFDIHISGASSSLPEFQGNTTPVAVTVNAGQAYAVSVTPGLSYASSLSPDCNGSLMAGDSVVCTVTLNDLETGGAGSPAPNLIANPGFETASGNLPQGWTRELTVTSSAMFRCLPIP